MEYTIITGDYAHHVAADVNKLIAEGWEPLGGVGVSIHVHEDGNWLHRFAQALVKEDAKTNPFCQQCGRHFSERACGPAHAIRAEEAANRKT
jgi:hypothetical protein